MDKRMPKKSVDELAIVKAAAWAWYQHGSGYEGKPMREFDLSRAHRAPKPSRYKQEAMKNTNADCLTESPRSPTSESSILALSPTHTDMSLLDSYEIARIASQLDCILASTGTRYTDKYADDGGSRCPGKGVGSPMLGNDTIKKTAGKLNGFWLRHAIGICSTRGEVVEPMALGGSHRRRQARVMRLHNSRPKFNTK